MTNTKISDNEVISRQSGSWSCVTIASISQQKTRNRLVWVDGSSVKLKEASGETMTVKMNDGNFYDGDASELTFSFSNPNGNLGLDTGSEASDTWYYLYAIPNGSTFSIIASTISPLNGTLVYFQVVGIILRSVLSFFRYLTFAPAQNKTFSYYVYQCNFRHLKGITQFYLIEINYYRR